MNDKKRHLNDADWAAIKEKHSKFTPEEARAFWRRVMGRDSRKLEGDEKEHMLTIFQLIDPISSSNNQRSFTDVHRHAGKTYHVHWFSKDDIEVEEILPNDIE